jgi:hypothetical protein
MFGSHSSCDGRLLQHLLDRRKRQHNFFGEQLKLLRDRAVVGLCHGATVLDRDRRPVWTAIGKTAQSDFDARKTLQSPPTIRPAALARNGSGPMRSRGGGPGVGRSERNSQLGPMVTSLDPGLSDSRAPNGRRA